MRKITTATPEQWKQIDEIRERWLAEQTRDVSYEQVRSAVVRQYEILGTPAPLVFQVDGPFATSAAFVGLCSDANSQLGSQLGSQLYSQLGSQLSSQLSSQLDSQLHSQLYSQLRSQLHSQLHSQLYSQLDSQWSCLWWQVWAAWHEAGKVLGVQYDESVLRDATAWCVSVPCGRFSETLAVVSRWPERVLWRNGVLHCEDGPSVRFRDGFSLWSIGGVAADEQIVMRPETQTIEQINGDNNEERRRVRIEQFGWLRYLTEAGATKQHSRRNDRDAQQEELFRLSDGTQRFVCVDPSTGRKYALGVPRDIETCEQAQRWISHGLDARAIHRS